MRAFVMELSETHHNTFMSIYTATKKAGFPTYAVVSSDVYKKIGRSISATVFGVPSSSYKGKGKVAKIKTALSDVRDDMALYMWLKYVVRPKRGDVFILTTADLFLVRHIWGAMAIIKLVKNIGATLIGGIHNTFVLFDEEELSEEEKEWIKEHTRKWKWHVWKRIEITRRYLKYFDGFFTLGKLKVPGGLKYTLMRDRYTTAWENPRDFFNIIVPGSITPGRLDIGAIKRVINLIEGLRGARLILLGRIEGGVYIPPHQKVVVFDSFIPESVYMDYLKKGHVVFLPLRNPYYGTFSVSGGVGDAVAGGMPVILPDFYRDEGEYMSKYGDVAEALDMVREFYSRWEKGQFRKYTVSEGGDIERWRRFIEGVAM